MGYSNINATPNYQLQGFGQSGMRTISTSQAYVDGEYYRVLVATQDSTISATSVIGDDITDLQVYAGTTIYGLFTAVSVSVGEVTAYLAGATDIESVWSYINTYGLNNGAIIEAADCAKDAIEPLLDKYYAQASLVLVPSLYKTSVVYAERPLDANGQLTFTRASGATRVGPNGYIEKVRTNRALYSEDQSNAQYASVINEIDSRVAVANPLTGQNNAYKITSTSGGDPYIGNIVGGLTDGENTFSLWLWTDAGQSTEAVLFFYNALATEVYFKPLTITTTPTRYSFTVNFASVGASAIVRLDLRQSGAASYLYTYGWQAESGVMTDYIPTTTTAVSVGPVSNLPRLDYPINADGSVGCPSLLLEPQRTNTLALSEQFDNAYFTKAASSVTANAAISPSGYQDADKLVPDTSNAIHSVYRSSQPIVGGIYSVFAKADGYNWILLASHPSSSPAARGAFFNVGNGTIGTAAAGINAKIENYGNGWYRCSINEGGSPSTIWSVIPTNADNVTTFAGNGTDGVLIWGGQNEQGSYATSYIPTLGASVTRVGSAVYKGSIASLIGATEGVLFVDFIKPPTASTRTKIARAAALLTDGGNSFLQSINLDLETNGNLRANIVDTTTQVDIQTGAYSAGTRIKMAFAYKENDCVLYINGTQIGTDTSCTIPVCTAYEIGSYETANNTQTNYVSQALLFKTRLTNQQLQELTSL
jgi:hypothetical protein